MTTRNTIKTLPAFGIIDGRKKTQDKRLTNKKKQESSAKKLWVLQDKPDKNKWKQPE